MPNSRIWLASAAILAALGACTTADAPPADSMVAQPSGPNALEFAMEAAGGKAALAKVQEVFFSGDAKVTVDGKTAEQTTAVLVRPFSFYRVTSWAKGAEPKTAKTTQAELGKAWDVTRVTWQPMPEAGANFENEQLALFSTMLLAPLSAEGVVVTEMPVANTGTRAFQVQRPGAKAVEIALDGSGKLVSATYSGTDPKTGAAVTETATFSGEVTSNGVKWPRHIKIARDGSAWYEVEITTFEALPNKTVRPLAQAMQYDSSAPPSDDDAG